ncbi:MAG: OadG family protein [Porticoccaceae bacterium]
MADGLNLMLYGMGTVFVFLTLLVACTSIMSALVTRFYQEPAAESAAVKDSRSIDSKTIAIIKAAIAEHKKSKSN